MTRRTRQLLVMTVSTVLAVLVAALALSILDDDGEPRAEPTDITGFDGTAPPLELAGEPVPEIGYVRLADGVESDLDALRGRRPAVINFFGSWCAPCIREMPGFEQVHREVGDRVAFLGLAERDTEEDARDLVAETGVTYETGRDLRGEALEALSVTVMPSTVFVAADGTITSTHVSDITAAELEQRIRDELL